MSPIISEHIRVAFVGNPNSGKTTLFNGLSGSNIKVGNWPGVTVEKIEAEIQYHNKDIKMVDLPGIYSLDTYTPEEAITKEFLLEGDIDLIVNILDATMLRRHLFLTLQLIKLQKPMIIVLNMMDLVKKKGITFDLKRLSQDLGGIRIIPLTASKKSGLADLLDLLTTAIPMSETVNINLPVTYERIDSILKDCNYQSEKKDHMTDRVDQVLLHSIWGVPIFLCLMAVVFWLTFAVGDWLKEYLQQAISWLILGIEKSLLLAGANDWVISLLIDGIAAGVGVIITFLPNLVILFIAMAIMEDSGYIARVAYLMNDLMKKVGLSGKAFIPMLLGFGCTVPAIMATRILNDEKEKKRALILLPFMSCSAKLPIYMLFATMFYRGCEAIVVFGMYVISFLLGIFLMYLIRKRDSNISSVLLIELPEYKMPDSYSVYSYLKEKVRDYLGKAGTTIFLASLVLWFLLHMNKDGLVTDISKSFAAMIGEALVPLFKPAGLGYWQMIVALIAGFSAKEVVVSSFSILFGIGNLNAPDGIQKLSQIFAFLGIGRIQSIGFMVFCLLYTPCISALAMVKKEMNSVLWMIRILLLQTGLAWGMSVLCYQLGRVFIGG